jgi:hypothetical protein
VVIGSPCLGNWMHGASLRHHNAPVPGGARRRGARRRGKVERACDGGEGQGMHSQPLIEAPWLCFTSRIQRFRHPPRLNHSPCGARARALTTR